MTRPDHRRLVPAPRTVNSCRGCRLCAGNANAHGHRFGCLLECVKCGVEHAAFHARPAPCVPQPGDHSDADQQFRFNIGDWP